MEFLQVPESRKIIEPYHEGHITLRKLMEELEWYWDKSIYKGTRAPIVERARGPVSAILKQDQQPNGNLLIHAKRTLRFGTPPRYHVVPPKRSYP